MQHLDFSHSNGTEMRVSKPHLVESVARAALKNVPGSQAILAKHFPKGDWKPTHPIKLPAIKPQKYYSGYGTI